MGRQGHTDQRSDCQRCAEEIRFDEPQMGQQARNPFIEKQDRQP